MSKHSELTTGVQEPAAGAEATQTATDPTEGCDLPWCGAGPLPASSTGRLLMPVEWLTAHPHNVRTDLDLDPEFCASVAENGVLIPLRITIDGDGAGEAARYRVIDGHRRLAAAVRAGLAEVPYDLVTERQGDEAAQFLDMFNAHRHRKGYTRLEEADALFGASEAGATRTRIRKSTGLKPAQVKAVLAAATLGGETRASIEEVSRERGDDMTLDDPAILAEFQDDPEALSQLLDLAGYHDGLEHQAERLRQERAERARHEKLRADLAAGDLRITDDLPPGALLLTLLTHDGEQLTAQTHATCPGRGAYFRAWDLENPVHYCSDPAAYGHERPGAVSPGRPEPAIPPFGSPSSSSSGAGVPACGPAVPPAEDPEVAASRRLVVEGHRAWRAAAEVRHRWLAGQLFPRRSAPREVDVFVADQLLTMPEVLRRYLSSASASSVFATVTGQQCAQMAEACAGATTRKLPLLMLAPIATTYEHALTSSAGGQDTWRDGRYSPCSYAEAGRYFTFLASIGYQLSVIERCVADGTPYGGETPAGDILTAGPDGSPPDVDTEDGQDVPPYAEPVEDVPDGSCAQDVPAELEDVPDRLHQGQDVAGQTGDVPDSPGDSGAEDGPELAAA